MRTLFLSLSLLAPALTGCPAPSADCAPVDADADGFAAPGCDVDPRDADCDDDDDQIHPDAAEVCGGADDDCDGLVDNLDLDLVATDRLWYRDADADGLGDPGSRWTGCTSEPAPPGYVGRAGDCDDTSPQIGAGCDGSCGALPVWHADGDRDGYGDDKVTLQACHPPEGWVAAGGDCADGDTKIHPDADELCNAFDDDCDGQIDEVDASFVGDTWTWLLDSDGDGFGAASRPVVTCSPFPGLGLTDVDGDCDDDDPDAHPGAEEWCDDVDQDCDGAAWRPDTRALLDGGRRAGWGGAPVVAGALHLCDVTIDGPLVIDGDVALIGHGEAVIRGDGASAALAARGALVLDGLTVTGGPELDAAVVHAGPSLTLRRVTLRDNPGGGLRTSAETVRVIDSELLDNTAPAGAALRLEAPVVDAQIEGGRVAGNQAQDGAAVAIDGAGALTARGVRFEANVGGALAAPALDALVLDDVLVVGNTGERVPAVVGSRWYTRVEGSAFAGNRTASGRVAGLWVLGVPGDGRAVSEVHLVNTGFVAQQGGALAARDALVHVYGGTWADNHADRGGAAIWLDGASALDLEGAALRGDTVDADGDGGAIRLEGQGWASLRGASITGAATGGRGGALALLGGWSLACEGSALQGNAAARGGAVWLGVADGRTPSFLAVACDFGAQGNAPDDVATADDAWILPGAVDVLCEPGCE